jgi:hypothetical protein
MIARFCKHRTSSIVRQGDDSPAMPILESLRIFIAWKHAPSEDRKGTFSITNGCVLEVIAHQGGCVVSGDKVESSSSDPVVVELALNLSGARYGATTPVVRWQANQDSFSFLPTTIPQQGCIQAPDFGVVIGLSLQAVQATDWGNRSYEAVWDRCDSPRGREIGWETWAARNNRLPDVPTVLGLSRDQRTFIINPTEDSITSAIDIYRPEINYTFNRVSSPNRRCHRSLDEGYLPILHSREDYGGVAIEDTLFASFIDRPLTEENLDGTPIEIAHLFACVSTFPPGMKEVVEDRAATYEAQGELVLFLRTHFINRSDIPLLAPQRLPKATLVRASKAEPQDSPPLDENGVAWTNGMPLSLHRVNGLPATSLQPCVLLAPGETMTIDSILSHRSEGLSEQAQKGGIAWDEKLAEARAFWHGKLAPAASVSLPEDRLENFWKAGLIHLDLVTLGQSKEGALLPKVGIYTAIGTESLPIVEFYDSVGCHDIARRCVDCFFDLQNDDGRINIYAHYDIETGGALFMAGRHFAYTRDKAWASNRAIQIKRAADYLLRIRQLESPEEPNYGLIAGTCADPTEATTAFMLNAYAAAGLVATADMLEAISDSEAAKYREAANAFIAVYQKAFSRSFEQGPLIPTAPGRWVPSYAPSVEGVGLGMMGLKGEALFTHRCYAAFDAVLGALYGVSTGIIGINEKQTQWLLEVNHAHLNRACVAESQPYYSRHPEIHLLRGEREPFLNAFYSGLTSLSDRDTFSFWEHYHLVSLHKTHEEAWALMQLRRMLWLECGSELRLLPGIPEDWLDAGKSVKVERAGSYFGGLSFRIERCANENQIQLHWSPEFHTPPESVRIHLPGISVGDTLEPRLTRKTEGWIEIADPATPLVATLPLI